MKVVQIGTLGDDFDRRLAERHDTLQLWRLSDPDAALALRAPQLEALVTSARFSTGEDLLERLPALRAICNFGVGYETIDVEAAIARGIVISNTPDVLTDCVADLAIGMILASARRIAWYDRFVREGRWGRDPIGLSTRVTGKRLGIVGLGRIGEAVAKRAAAFDMPIAYTGRRPSPRALPSQRFEPSLKTLAEWSDFLVVSCVGGPSTAGLVDGSVLRALGPSGTLVNISRGSVIDEPALIEALKSGALGAAALDVFETEPEVRPEFQTLENVVLLPHVGSATVETRRAMGDLVLENLDAFEQGGVLVTPIPETEARIR